MTGEELRELAHKAPLASLMREAAALRDAAHGDHVSYSRKVFIPLTRLCRDVCHYCTFARPPSRGQRAYLTREEVLAIAEAGAAAGCKEALFTLGDKPELRYASAARELQDLGYASTIDYLVAMCRAVLEETGLLPHANPGVVSRTELQALREVSASQGLMLESAAERLCAKGGPHHGSPDKHPQRRLDTIAAAGALDIPYTTGILIGIGETRAERIDALLALRDLHERYGHLQEIIVQSFRAKPGTRMQRAPDASVDELLWTASVARLAFGTSLAIQAPPNLSPGACARLLDAGVGDWGGVSPITPDHVNPEAPWPELQRLEAETAACGRQLVERLASYPRYSVEASRWHAPHIARRIRACIDAEGYARTDAWTPGRGDPPREALALVARAPGGRSASGSIDRMLARGERGELLDEADIAALFGARGQGAQAVCATADRLRVRRNGERVRYVVNRNINYTNVCVYKCSFCAFSKGRRAAADRELRGAAYDLSLAEISRRAAEAWERGATEVCMQGGIHPDYTGDTYVEILRAAKAGAPSLHVHAFSPLEVSHGARSTGVSVGAFLARLREAGLGSLPGTAAEILDDDMRRILCPDKVSSAEWLEVMASASRVGLRATATIMFGHVERPEHWARHLLRIRALQERTGVFTEFVPLPFVHMEAPLSLRGVARPGPTFREALLMHAIARIVLDPVLDHIQASWVKLGPRGGQACLAAGADDMGGTLMNESISRAAGTQHGQELAPADMDALIRAAGRSPGQRTTLYAEADCLQQARSYAAPALAPLVQTPIARRRHATAHS